MLEGVVESVGSIFDLWLPKRQPWRGIVAALYIVVGCAILWIAIYYLASIL